MIEEPLDRNRLVKLVNVINVVKVTNVGDVLDALDRFSVARPPLLLLDAMPYQYKPWEFVFACIFCHEMHFGVRIVFRPRYSHDSEPETASPGPSRGRFSTRQKGLSLKSFPFFFLTLTPVTLYIQ